MGNFKKTELSDNWINYYHQQALELFEKATLSTTNGISIYVEYRGFKLRFSDHQTGISRQQEEVNFGLNFDKNNINERLDWIEKRNNKNNWIEVEKKMLNTEFGFNKLNPNSKIISKDFKRLSKKGTELFEFTYISLVFEN